MKNRSAVFLLAHFLTPVVVQKAERLIRELDGYSDVFVLSQNPHQISGGATRDKVIDRLIIEFDPEYVPATLGYPFSFNNSILPGSNHFPFLLAFMQSDYDYGFLVEYDVEFSGNWLELISTTIEKRPDFASCHFLPYQEKPDWQWWYLYLFPETDADWAMDKTNFWRSFNPIYCISKSASRLIHEAHKNGWRAHHELLLATLAKKHGLETLDFREYGFYAGIEQELNQFASIDECSTFRWRPAITPEEFRRRSQGRTLFHPVKESWFFDGSSIVEIADEPSS